MNQVQQTTDTVKHILDIAAGGVMAATLMSWLPPIAALLTAIYTALRIYEWFEKRAARKRHGDNKC